MQYKPVKIFNRFTNEFITHGCVGISKGEVACIVSHTGIPYSLTNPNIRIEVQE